jgi:pyruvate/2-oxoglutarate dehydrogenase complex dihydrolipoamide acyltransferase (E2) component
MSKIERFDIQRRVVSHMVTTSWQNVPHVTFLYEPDITTFYHEYKELSRKRRNEGKEISFNTMILRVIVEGLKSAPQLNSYISYDHQRAEGSLKIQDDINISIPWLLPDGRMITPVLLKAQTKTLNELSDAMSELNEKIHNTNVDELLYRAALDDTLSAIKRCKLGVLRRTIASQISFHRVTGLSGKEKSDYYKIPEDKRLTARNLLSGTVTVSNIGSLYKEQKGFFGLLEIIPPQIFAIGVGAIQEKPGVFIDDKGEMAIGIRKILPLCLVFDHRAVDFSAVVPFLKKTDQIFLKPDVIRKW